MCVVLAAVLGFVLLPGFDTETTHAATAGLVAAYGFGEGSGTTVADASGNGNTGTISNATWTATGKYGSALSFNGTNARINVPNSASLQLTTGMTLEAWVNPASVSSAWRDVIYKGNDNYYLEATSTHSSAPDGGGTFGGSGTDTFGTAALAANTWSYLALTYDGSTLRLYVNGTQVATQAKTGAITTSTNQLQIGGDSIYGQYFNGTIDEVRIYNTALTAAAIQTDMTTPVNSSGDTTPPSAPGTLTASASSPTEVDLSWGAATDNVGVTGYQIFRCQGAGCTNFAQVGQATATTYADTSLAPSTPYNYEVRAVDAAGNVGGFSNIGSATTQSGADTVPPSTPTGLAVSAVAQKSMTLSWNASSDNVGVTGYRMYLNGNQIDTSLTTSYLYANLTCGTSYTLGVAAVDAAGNASNIATTVQQTAACSDTTPPSAPGTLSSTAVSAGEIDLSWGAATDNVGVTGYQIFRCQGAGCTNFAQVGQATGTTYNDTGLSSTTSYSYQVRATDAAGNLGNFSNTTTATTKTSSDTQPPTQPGTPNASAVSSTEIDLSWAASTDNVGVTGYQIFRCQGGSCTNFAQVGQATGTTYNDTGLTASTSYSYEIRATDAAGNLSTFSTSASATTQAATGGGLVAAYSFNEGAGTSVTDSSGNGNTGTISNATWTNAGKYGSALVFNGTNARVDVPNSASLQLSSGMTLEAWVDPTTVSNVWRDVIYKGSDNYYLEATSDHTSVPDGGGTFGGSSADAFGTASALPANTWSHLALTYDGSTLRLYLNGNQIGTQAKTGAIATSTNPLQIGGDSIYGQYFSGMIDEVKIYNVALTAAQIQSDMVAGSGGPTAPTNLIASAASTSEIDLSWGASTGGTGVTGYRIERCQGQGCSNFTQIGTSSSTSFADTGLTATTSYSYRVRAVDSSGGLSPYSGVAAGYTGLVVTPGQYAITPGLTQQFNAAGVGSGTVTWSVDGIAGGNPTVGTITSGGLYTAANSVGQHTVSASQGSLTGNATVYITNYAGTFTYHNDNLRTGAQTSETVLTPSNVNSSQFGKLFSYPLDGLTLASPLYVENVSIPGQGVHNVVYVATEHDSVYAFDADGRTSTPLWHDSFINPSQGITPVPAADTGETGDIPNEIGITSTPVIDPATNTMYVDAATKVVSGGTTTYFHKLHALDLTTGAEKFGGPVTVQASVPGTGMGSSGGTLSFVPLRQNQRPGLLLSNGVVYLGFSSRGDQEPFHGWVLGYNASNLQQVLVYASTPNGDDGGVWMSGDGLAADSSGNIYFITGDGLFDASTGGKDYGDSFVKMNPAGSVLDYFSPRVQSSLNSGNLDLGSGGALLLPDQPGAHPHEMVSAGKNGTVYLVDRDNMGHFNQNSDQIVQSLTNIWTKQTGGEAGLFGAPAYFNGSVYFSPLADTVQAFQLTNGLLSTSPTSQSPETYDGTTDTFDSRGGTLAVSANGTSNGILWALQSNGDTAGGTLHAYDATNLSHELYNSDQAGTRDQLDAWLKFTVPTVANGRVYVTTSGQLVVYGLLP